MSSVFRVEWLQVSFNLQDWGHLVVKGRYCRKKHRRVTQWFKLITVYVINVASVFYWAEVFTLLGLWFFFFFFLTLFHRLIYKIQEVWFVAVFWRVMKRVGHGQWMCITNCLLLFFYIYILHFCVFCSIPNGNWSFSSTYSALVTVTQQGEVSFLFFYWASHIVKGLTKVVLWY